MSQNVVVFLLGFIFFIQPVRALDFLPDGSGGPWLVYQYVGPSEEGPLFLEGTLFILNLGYVQDSDKAPQFAFTEADPDEDLWLNLKITLKIDKKTKKRTVVKKEIFKQTWDGDNTSVLNNHNQWHRLSWGREGNTFALLYSQYEVLEDNGVADHGVFFGSGTCLTWPNTVGKGNKKRIRGIGIEGKYPETISISMMRLDGGWEIPSGTLPGYGSRQVKLGTFNATLDIGTTLALNQNWADPTTKESVDTNAEAKEWVYTYYDTVLGYDPLPDQNDS